MDADEVGRFVEELVTAPSWARTVELIQEHPDLLGPATRHIEQLRATIDDDHAAEVLAYHQRLLELSIETSVTRALAEFYPFKSDEGRPEDIRWIDSLIFELSGKSGWYQRRVFLEERPFLMNGLAADLADLIADDQPDPRGEKAARQIAKFLRRCQEIGLLEAVLEHAVLSMIYAPGAPEAMEVAADYPPVLSRHADDVARAHIESIEDAGQRASAETWWTSLRDALASVPGAEGQVLRYLEYADLLDELATITETDGLIRFLTDHPELLAENSQEAARHRRDDAASFRQWWEWDRYQRLLRRAGQGTVPAAVAAFQASDRYDAAVGAAALLHARSNFDMYLLYLAFPGLGTGLVTGQLAEIAERSGDPGLVARVEALSGYLKPHPVNEFLPADAWDGRHLAAGPSSGLHRDVMAHVRGEPGDLALGILEVLQRLGTLDPAQVVEVTSAAASLHLRLSEEIPAAQRAVELLVECVANVRLAADARPEHHAAALVGLANGYAGLAERSGDIASRDTAVETARQAHAAAPDDHDVRLLLARLLGDYPAHAYDPARVDEALGLLAEDERDERIEVLGAALSVTRSADEAESRLAEATRTARSIGTAPAWQQVAETATMAYRLHGRRALWDGGWAAATAAEESAADVDGRQRARNARADLIAVRTEYEPDAVPMLDEALALTDPLPAGTLAGDVEAERRGTRANVLITRHARGEQNEADLRQAVDLLRELRNQEAARRIAVETLLAWGLSALYELTGDLAVLDESIELNTQTLARHPGARPVRAALGSAWRRRFMSSGKVSDLARAISVLEEGVPNDRRLSPVDAMLLNNLATAYGTRFEMLGDTGDAERELGLLERAADAFPGNAHVLTNLGVSLTRRGRERADARDLDRAIEMTARADELTPRESVFKARRLVNRGAAHLSAALVTGRASHADAAIGFLTRAIELVGPSSPFRGMYQMDVVAALRIKAEVTGDQRFLTEACRVGDEGITTLRKFLPSWLPQASTMIGYCHAELGDWEGAARVFAAGAELADLLTGAQASRPHRQGWLRRAGSLSMDAAYALAKDGDLAAAVAAAERGRARELTRSLDLFSVEVDSLVRSGFGQLARRWQELAARVAGQDRVSLEDSGVPDGAEALIERLREARASVDAVLTPSGVVPPAETTLVYLITTDFGGLAIVAAGQQPLVPVWLPELTASWTSDRARSVLTAEPSALDEILPPLLDELRPLMSRVLAAAGGRSVALVPGGLLSVLPLAAAVEDSVRHAPNARILRAQPEQVTAATAIQSSFGDLPYVAVEAALVAAALPAGSVLSDATPEIALAALGGPGVVHFACHARSVPASPLDSALLLGTQTRLGLRDILRGGPLAADLVVLSACETAVPGDELPDEMTGLPAALLQAGASGVIGTLWQVADDACLWLTLALYTGLRAGARPWEALRDARELLRTATAAGLSDYLSSLSWPPRAAAAACRETLSDLDPASRPFEHPADWAGFVYIG